MQPDLQYMKHPLNTSTFRNACKFSKGSRFASTAKTPTDYNYDVRSKPTSRSCTFGIGDRPVLANSMAAPPPDRYNVACFPSDKRATSLGQSRNNAIFRSLNNYVQKKAELPPPGAYNVLQSEREKGFSLRMKLPGEIEIAVKKRVPGPGHYKAMQMCTSGRYASSKIRNTRCISFGSPKGEVFKRSSGLGPGAYDIFNMDSSFSKVKIQGMKKNRSKNFGSANRSTLEDRSKSFVPGPGNYASFSLFGDQ